MNKRWRLPLLAPVIVLGVDLLSASSFERMIGGPKTDRGVFVTPTSDGGYVVVGATSSYGAGGEDAYLVRTDSEGELLWARTFGGPGEDNGWQVEELSDGLLVAGFTSSFGAGGFDCYLIKTDSNGELEWSRTYGGEGKDRCWGMVAAGDGGNVLVGETTSEGAGEEDCLLVKVGSGGEELWSRTFGGERSDRCFSIARAEGGGFVLAGQTYSDGAGDRDAYILKTSSSGEFEWSKTFGGAASDVGHSVTAVPDGSFLMTGYTTSLSESGDDPYLVKIDAQGEVHWTRVLHLEGINHTLTGDLTHDGGFCLTGFSAHSERGASAAMLVKTDPEGHLEWSEEFFSSHTGQSLGYTVRATSDGGCVFTGHATVSGSEDLDMLLVKVEAEGDR